MKFAWSIKEAVVRKRNLKFILLVTPLFFFGCENKNKSKPANHAANSSSQTHQMADGKGPTNSTNPNYVATVGDVTISHDDLADAIKANLYEMDKKIYALKKRALDDLITNALVAMKAKSENMSAEEFRKQKISVLLKVEKKEVAEFYKKNKTRIHGPEEQTHARIENYLKQKKERNYYKKLLADAQKEKLIHTYLQEPQSPIFKVSEDNDPSFGGKQAKIVIIAFSDFECPFCARVKPTIQKIKETYKDEVRIVFRDFPLSFHAKAKTAAIAAECAEDQGKFWEYHDILFDNQRKLEEDSLVKYASDLKLNVTEFKKCLKDPQKLEEVEKDIEDGKRLGVKATPTFFINGRMHSGVLSLHEFKSKIDETLKR